MAFNTGGIPRSTTIRGRSGGASWHAVFHRPALKGRKGFVGIYYLNWRVGGGKEVVGGKEKVIRRRERESDKERWSVKASIFRR